MTTFFKVLLTIICGLLGTISYVKYGLMTFDERKKTIQEKISIVEHIFQLIFYSCIIIIIWVLF